VILQSGHGTVERHHRRGRFPEHALDVRRHDLGARRSVDHEPHPVRLDSGASLAKAGVDVGTTSRRARAPDDHICGRQTPPRAGIHDAGARDLTSTSPPRPPRCAATTPGPPPHLRVAPPPRGTLPDAPGRGVNFRGHLGDTPASSSRNGRRPPSGMPRAEATSSPRGSTSNTTHERSDCAGLGEMGRDERATGAASRRVYPRPLSRDARRVVERQRTRTRDSSSSRSTGQTVEAATPAAMAAERRTDSRLAIAMQVCPPARTEQPRLRKRGRARDDERRPRPAVRRDGANTCDAASIDKCSSSSSTRARRAPAPREHLPMPGPSPPCRHVVTPNDTC
jgi:hypothetical protein